LYYQPGPSSGVNPRTGLNRATTYWHCFSDWDLGSYIYAMIYARKLGLIQDGNGSDDWQFNDRINKVLSFLQNRALGTGNNPYLAYEWNSLPGTRCSDTGSQTSNPADEGRLLAALYALKTFRTDLSNRVDSIFTRSKTAYDHMVTEITFPDYYGYLAAEGFAGFGYDESAVFNALDSYSGRYVSNSLTYGQSLPAIKTLAEPLMHLILESDTLVHPLSSSVVDFAKRVYLTQSGRWSATGKLTAWSEGSYPAPIAYVYEWILVNCSSSSCNQWVLANAFGSVMYSSVRYSPLAYVKVAFSYLAIYGENSYTLALVNVAKTLASSVGFGEATKEDSEHVNWGQSTPFTSNLTSEFILASAYHVLNSSTKQSSRTSATLSSFMPPMATTGTDTLPFTCRSISSPASLVPGFDGVG